MSEKNDNNTFEISRRKTLAALGTIGAASAGAGLGTSAWFSDTETFENNTITAGELDLKVDWEEHYYDGSAGSQYVYYSDPGENGVPFPDPQNPHVWLDSDEVIPEFMNATSIEAFPDPNNDGIQEMQDGNWSYDPCEMGADTMEDLTPSEDGATRSSNDDTMVDGEAQPLLNLDDVKPGDFGELTLSFHLCDNPGYVWLQAGNVSEGENGETEPEALVDDAQGGELASNIQTAWWYDTDGNNIIDESIGEVDVMIAVDRSGSLSGDEVTALQGYANDLASDLEDTGHARVGGLSFGNGTIDDFTSLSGGPVEFTGLSADGNTPMPAALDVAAEELSVNGRADAETFIVMFTDGGPNYPNNGYDEFSIGGGYTPGPYTEGDPSNSIVEDAELCETEEVAAAIRDDHRILTVGLADDESITGNPDANVCEGGPSVPTLRAYLRDYIAGSDADYYSAADVDDIGSILHDILENVAMPEEVFRRGTLAEDLAVLADGNGIPLDGNRSTEFDELDDVPDDGDRECFVPGVTEFIGFAWWLPTSVGNEVQSDSVSFDLGFYTEQCRHNDGAGMVAENTSAPNGTTTVEGNNSQI